MLDFTPQIGLTNKQSHYYLISRTIVMLAFVIGCIFFAKELLFPTRSFSYVDTIDSLARTITDPVIVDDRTLLSIASANTANRAKITITTKSSITPHPEISLQKSYLGHLYPDLLESVTSTETELPFPNGSLLASASGVFLTAGSQVRAFDTEQTLLSLGYSFDDVIQASSADFAPYKKGKIISVKSPHPAGTVFTTERSAPGEILVGADAAQQSVSCQTTSFYSQMYTCTLDLSALSSFPGKRYAFTSADFSPEDIREITIKLYTVASRQNLNERIREIRQILAK